MAKGAPPRFSVGELIAEGSDFARVAWRDCWAPMLLVIVGHTVLFLNQHAPPTEWRPGLLGWLLPLCLIFYIPLFGGLYRAALGGEPFRKRGPGGLQWRGDEWLMIVVGAVIAVFIGLAMVPFLALNGLAILILHGRTTFGPLGEWAAWAPAGVVIWAVFALLVAPRAARLALGWPYSIARARLHPLAGWGPAHRQGWSIAIALLFALVPILLGQLCLYALTLVQPDIFALDYWPLPYATAAGVLQAVLKAAVAAPISVGVLVGAFALLEGARQAEPSVADLHTEATHHDLPDDAALAAAAALAAREAAELGLPPSEVDHSVTDAPADEVAAEASPEANVEAATTGHEAETPSPEAEHPHHEGLVEAAIAAALAAAAAAAAAHEIESAHHPAPEPIPEPEIVHPPEPEPEPAHAAIEPLSPWPHSVLPPWPVRLAQAAAVLAGTSALASNREPAQRS